MGSPCLRRTLTPSQVLVECLPTNPNLPRDLRFTDASRHPLVQCSDCCLRERLLAPLVCPSLFRQRDPFPLSLMDQGPLELGKAPHHQNRGLAMVESSPVKARCSLTNSMRTPRPVRVWTIRRKSSRLRASRSMLCRPPVL